MSFGFIILRCVKTKTHDTMWQECYQCIRKFYTNPILIIDDNSVPGMVSNIPLIDAIIIKSEYPRAGELLGYYYFHKLKPFEKAVIMHDSMFITRYINFQEINKQVKFLWHFNSKIGYAENQDQHTINQLNNSKELERLHKQKELWQGCFGAASFITLEFLDTLQMKYSLFELLPHLSKSNVKNRAARMSIERIFALLCFAEGQLIIDNCSLFGDILAYGYGQYKYHQYKAGKINAPIVKIWVGR